MQGPTMRWELSGSVFVVVHGPKPPGEDEYVDALGGYARHLGRFRSILIHSDGGAPNPAQRKRTTEFWEGKQVPRTAIMTSSNFARGVITALNWFFPQELKAVKAGQYEAAFDFLDVPLIDRKPAERTVERLRAELAG